MTCPFTSPKAIAVGAVDDDPEVGAELRKSFYVAFLESRLKMSNVMPSEKRRKMSKNSQKDINSFLFLIAIELYDDPFLWVVKLTQIT
jgi:hypothetical protein